MFRETSQAGDRPFSSQPSDKTCDSSSAALMEDAFEYFSSTWMKLILFGGKHSVPTVDGSPLIGSDWNMEYEIGATNTKRQAVYHLRRNKFAKSHNILTYKRSSNEFALFNEFTFEEKIHEIDYWICFLFGVYVLTALLNLCNRLGLPHKMQLKKNR